jgi:hypothetical protein
MHVSFSIIPTELLLQAFIILNAVLLCGRNNDRELLAFCSRSLLQLFLIYLKHKNYFTQHGPDMPCIKHSVPFLSSFPSSD